MPKPIIRVSKMIFSHNYSDPSEPEILYRQGEGDYLYVTEDIISISWSVEFNKREVIRVETTNSIYVKV